MSNQFIGEIRAFPYGFAPKGWAFCSAQTLSIAQNQALFSILGTTYGGNGVTTFLLPDLRSRVPVGAGQGPGLSSFDLGQLGGTETVTLTIQQIPQHNHMFTATTAAATKKPFNNALFADDIDTEAVDYFALPNAPNSSFQPLNPLSLSQAGNNQPHPNLQPYSVTGWCIALQGIFPSRN